MGLAVPAKSIGQSVIGQEGEEHERIKAAKAGWGEDILWTARYGRGGLLSVIVLALIWGTTLCGSALAQGEPAQQSSQQPNSQPTQQPPAAPQPENSQPDQPVTDQPVTDQPVKDQPAANEKPQDRKQEEKKDDAPNPAQAAAEATKEVAEAALVKAADWERGWFVGVYVEKGRPLVPMTVKQRREIYLQGTLATPGVYLKRMFDAGIDQWRNSPPQWGQGWGAYGERFASREGQFVAANSLAALGNAALHYEVRYDQCNCQGFWARTRHAIVRNFLTYDQSEQELRPQWGLYAGSFGGGVISTAWKPHPRNAFAEGGRAMAGQVAWGSLLNIFIEFSTDVNRAIGRKIDAMR
jgi:hypothetical protein